MTHLLTTLTNPGHPRRAGFPAMTRTIAAAGALVAVALVSSSDDGPVLCPYRRCTGGYCPGCGLTRAAGQLIRGDVAGSWSHHPFLLIALAQTVAGAALTAATPASRRSSRLRVAMLPVAAANAVVLLVIWTARLATGAIPLPFS